MERKVAVPPGHVSYRGVVMPNWKLSAVFAREQLVAIEADWDELPAEERNAIARVKRLARDARNAKLVARFAWYPLGTMGVARQYAAALCCLRQWRYTAAQLAS